MSRTVLFRTAVLLGLLLPATGQADPQLTAWSTVNSGKYARVYTTTANRTSGTSATTWNTSGTTLPHTLPAYADIYEIWYSNSWVYTKYTGLPSYVTGPWLNPQGAVGNFWPGTQSVIRRFPRSPSVQSGTKDSTAAGTSGIFVNGVAAFNSLDGQAWDGSQIQGQAQHTNGTYYWHRVAPVAESYNFDYALGHQLPAGLYHNHQNPIALRYQLGDHVDYNSSTKNYSESGTTVSTHSPILGYAHDGYPIYGPYGYSTATNSSSGVRRMVSGFVKRNGGTTGVDTVTSATTTMPAWYLRYRSNHSLGGTTNPVSVARSTNTGTYPIGTFAQDWAYLGDLIKTGSTYYAQGTDFDLDEYNGRYCVTPEYPGGTYAYFIAIDSSGAATYPYVFNFEFYGNASGGTVNSISESVTNYFTGGAGTALAIPNTPTVTNGTVSLTWNSVEGGTYSVEASTNQSTWTSKATGVSGASNATSTSTTYTALGSSGTEYARVQRTALASYDVPSVASTVTTAQSATKSYLAGANTAPTLTSISTLTGASKNTAFTISYATLAAAANEADSNGDALSFRIEGVSSGTLTKNGSAVTGGTTLISSGDEVVWTPATNVTGTVAAFTVKAWDGTDASSSAVTVNVTVANANTTPTLTTINALTGATEDSSFTISYATLAAAADEADLDGDTLSFRIEGVSSGTLTKGGVSVTAGSTLISSGDSVSWTPASNANGTIAAFTVKAWDGTATSTSATTVNVTVSSINDAPTLTTISTLSGAVKNTAFTISYDTLAAAANEADVDGDTVQFRVEGVSSGTLTKNGSSVSAGTTTITSGESLVWTPATDVTGTVGAFTVKAYDGATASSSAVAVNVTVAATVAIDAQLTSWYTARTGRYARIVETDTQLLADTTKTTWTRTSGPNTTAQTSPAYSGPQQVDYSSSWVYLRTPSLGTYTMGPWYNDTSRSDANLFVSLPKNQGFIVRFPRSSTLGAIPSTKTQTSGYTVSGVLQQGCGYFVDGVCMFDPTDGFSYSGGTESSPGTGSWHRDAYANESPTMDKSNAHQQNTGVYHNHLNPIALRYQLGDNVTFNSTTKAYSEGNTSAPSAHSPIIGWMLDGLPVYGPYGYSSAMDSGSGVRRMIGGFVLRNGTTTGVDNVTTAGRTVPAWATRNGVTSVNGPAVSTTYPLGRYVEDYAYLGDLIKTGSTKYQQGTDFDLNEYNVRYCVTPEFPNGTWAYFLNISSTGASQFPYMINRWFYGTPTGSTVTSISETVTNQFTGGANRPLTVTNTSVSGTNVTLTWNAVEGGTYSVDASTNNSTWTSKATGLTVSDANTKSDTHTALGTSGTEYARVNRTALATYDSTGTVAATVSQTTTTSFSLGSPNVAPTLTAISSLSGASEDTGFTISYAALATAADEADTNGDAISFRIEAVSSGTLTKGGVSVTEGSTLISSGDSVVWTPASNANGTLAAFTVKAYDGALASSTAIPVNVVVAAVNDAPTLANFSALNGASEDTPFTISYETLAAAGNEADVDGDALSFRVDFISRGTLTKNGEAVTVGSTLISSGDTVVWTPPANVSGSVESFVVRAYDGELASNNFVTVDIVVSAVNDASTLTAIDVITGAEEDEASTISYNALAAAADEADVDNASLSFRVESVTSGTLLKNGAEVVPGVTTISSGESLVWAPELNENGTIGAFTVKAYDGALASADAIEVRVNVAAVTDGAIWSGGAGTGQWVEAGNWIDHTIPTGWDAVILSGNAPYDLQLGESRNITSLFFIGDHAYTISQNSLTLHAGMLSTSDPSSGSLTHVISSAFSFDGALTASIAASASLELTGGVSGDQAWTKAGPGTLTMTGSSSYSGTLTISEGTVALGKTSEGTEISGSLDQATIVNNASLVSHPPSTFAGSLSGSGSWTVQGNGGTGVFTGSATHTGGTTVDGFNLVVGSGGTTGSIAGTITVNSGASLTFDLSDALTLSNTIQGEGTLFHQGAGALTLAGSISPIQASATQGATLNLTGTLDADALLAGRAGSSGIVNATNGAQLSLNALWIGDHGYGEVHLSDGSNLVTSGILFGGYSSGAGVMTVSGAETTLECGGIIQAVDATSSLTISNQGIAIFSAINVVPVTLDDATAIFSKVSNSSSPIIIASGGATVSVTNDSSGFSGQWSGPGVLTKVGHGVLILRGDSTRTGDTYVENGAIDTDRAIFPDAADVHVTSGAKLVLSYTGSDTIDELYIDGVKQNAGTWGAVGSGATFTSGIFQGTGVLKVTGGDVTFQGWASLQGLDGTTGKESGANDDPDKDGVPNQLEFVLGGDPLVASRSVLPTSSVSGGYITLHFNRNDLSETGVNLNVQYSSDLTTWTSNLVGTSSGTESGVIVTVEENGDSPDLITVSVPAGSNKKLFSRLVATSD